jgi:hypothetical protein
VYVPTVRPCAISSRVIICVVEPLPLVPVTWMTGYAVCGSPIASTSVRMRSSVGDSMRPVVS